MKYFAFLALVSLIPATLAFDWDTNQLHKRACVKTTCSCDGVPDGLFCGDDVLNCVKGNVYQCGGDGTKSCDFGVRKSCAQCNDLFC